MNQMKQYKLCDLSFIGGESQELNLKLFNSDNRQIDASNVISEFALSPYGHSIENPIFTTNGIVISSESSSFTPYLRIILKPEDTVYFSGKYIYQISLKDIFGNVELYHGLLTIENNNSKDFVIVTKLSN